MKKGSILTSLLLLFLCGAAQYDASKINKKSVQLYQNAMERIDEGNYASAAGMLLQAVELDKNYVDAYLSLGGIYGKLKAHKTAVSNYEKAFELDSNYTLEYKFQ